MYELKIVTQLAAAHQLREFEGPCENLHGHNWKIEVVVSGPELAPNGILLDFQQVKAATRKVVEELDHKFLNETECFRQINPSSENIARFIYQRLSRDLNDKNVKVSKVTAWESDSACASYAEP
jgi:6-pyruvoyltetrahydropterin/6-carboxytetrahydropterin synthase